MPSKHRICQQFNSPRGASLGDFRQVPTFSFSERKDTRRESSAYRTGYASFPEGDPRFMDTPVSPRPPGPARCPSVADRVRHRDPRRRPWRYPIGRSEEHTSELQSLMRSSYAVFCLKNKTTKYSSKTKKEK